VNEDWKAEQIAEVAACLAALKKFAHGPAGAEVSAEPFLAAVGALQVRLWELEAL
jgi:hypothetical protein